MLFIDTDNAMGSRRGDVDDGFAVAALLLAGIPIAGIASIFGNTTEPLAHRNSARIAEFCGSKAPQFRGAERAGHYDTSAAQALASIPEIDRIAALGPLTNLAAAHRLDSMKSVSEVVIVGGNSNTSGRWPPLWPHEFNLTKDCSATLEVFQSRLPLTVIPLNILSRLLVSERRLKQLESSLGRYIARESWRWGFRNRFLRLTSAFRVCDLIAAIYLIEPRQFEVRDTTALMSTSTFFKFGEGNRRLRLMTDYDPEFVWNRFVELINQTV